MRIDESEVTTFSDMLTLEVRQGVAWFDLRLERGADWVAGLSADEVASLVDERVVQLYPDYAFEATPPGEET